MTEQVLVEKRIASAVRAPNDSFYVKWTKLTDDVQRPGNHGWDAIDLLNEFI